MSMQQVLDTIDGALRDPVIGLSAAVSALADGDERIRADFAHGKWALAGTLNDSRSPNVMLRPRRWLAIAKRNDVGHRDAEAQVDIGYEFFGADVLQIQENIALVATALAQVLDALRQYSDDTGGTIIETVDPILFEFGQYQGPTSNGFLATITIIERSTL